MRAGLLYIVFSQDFHKQFLNRLKYFDLVLNVSFLERGDDEDEIGDFLRLDTD